MLSSDRLETAFVNKSRDKRGALSDVLTSDVPLDILACALKAENSLQPSSTSGVDNNAELFLVEYGLLSDAGGGQGLLNRGSAVVRFKLAFHGC